MEGRRFDISTLLQMEEWAGSRQESEEEQEIMDYVCVQGEAV